MLFANEPSAVVPDFKIRVSAYAATPAELTKDAVTFVIRDSSLTWARISVMALQTFTED